MGRQASSSTPGIQYEPGEKSPLALSLGLALQLTAVSVSATILIATVIFRAAGESEAYLTWAVFASIAIGGAATMIQSVRLGRLGSGHVLMMGSSSAFVAVAIDALVGGGPGMLVTLVAVTGLFQLFVSERLSLFRQILTPTVSATVLMLIPISVMSAIFRMLEDVPEGSVPMAAPLSALTTLAVFCGIILISTGAIRLWAPVMGVVAGALVAGIFGLYDISRIGEAAWIGLPQIEWPGLNVRFNGVFWSLLPGFLMAAMIGSIRTISSAVAIQRVSWRTPRAVDYRAVQGAVATDGLSNLISGLAGTIANTAYSTSASVAQLTGVASRYVGILAGLVFLALAFFPKAIALVLAIPGPVFGAYLIVLMGMLFMIGIQMLLQAGLDYRKSVIVGVSFWIGLGFQSRLIFPEFVVDFAGGLLNNGMTAGGLCAILMTIVTKMAESRPQRLTTELDFSCLDELRSFLMKFAGKSGWDQAMSERLDAVGEEVLVTLVQRRDADNQGGRRGLMVSARKVSGVAVMEFIAATGEGKNLQDQVSLLGEQVEEGQLEQEVSLRLLRHLATSVRHQQYHGADIMTVRVEAPASGAAGSE